MIEYKTVPVQFRLPKDMKDRLREVAVRNGKLPAMWVRDLVTAEVLRQERRNAKRAA